jgi:hypothetical protein
MSWVCPDHPIAGRESNIEVEVHWRLRHTVDGRHVEVPPLTHPYPAEIIAAYTERCTRCGGSGRIVRSERAARGSR